MNRGHYPQQPNHVTITTITLQLKHHPGPPLLGPIGAGEDFITAESIPGLQCLEDEITLCERCGFSSLEHQLC
jgi:hypothetical protein